MQKTVLLTGASSGIGKATALQLAREGYRVYGAARRSDKLQALEDAGVRPLTFDVTDETAVKMAVQQMLSECGRIDVLINNAGFGSYGAIEDVPLADARYQLEVNVLGAASLIREVLPGMRAQGSGKIINISSVAGKVASPFGGWYHASKFALEGLSDSLRNEVAPFGIRVILIEPGAIRSEWSGIARDNLLKTSGHTAYAQAAHVFAAALENISSRASEPVTIAKLISKALNSRHPKNRYAGGYMAKASLLLTRLLPQKLTDKLMQRQLNR